MSISLLLRDIFHCSVGAFGDDVVGQPSLIKTTQPRAKETESSSSSSLSEKTGMKRRRIVAGTTKRSTLTSHLSLQTRAVNCIVALYSAAIVGRWIPLLRVKALAPTPPTSLRIDFRSNIESNLIREMLQHDCSSMEVRRVDSSCTTVTSSSANDASFPPVVFLDQNKHYLVIDKPPAVVCHHSQWTGSRGGLPEGDGSGVEAEIPVLQRVRDQTGRRVNLVHRLDRGASGCLLMTYADHDARVVDKNDNNNPSTAIPAATSNTTTLLIQAMADKSMCTKTYIALVRGEGILHGRDLKKDGWFLVDRPIKNEKGVEKNATTWFRFVAGQGNGGGTIPGRARASLVLARPETGRWHQIRKHLNGLSHPILGDTTHGNSRVNREWHAKGLPQARICLHLSRLQIGPTEGVCPAGIDVSCELAPDMLQLLKDHLPDVLAAAEPTLRGEGVRI